MYIYAYDVRSLSGNLHHLYYICSSFSPIFNNWYTIQSLLLFYLFTFFLITHTLKKDGLATAFSITSQTELEKTNSSGLVKYDLSLFAEIPKYYFFTLIHISMDKTSKKGDRYL